MIHRARGNAAKLLLRKREPIGRLDRFLDVKIQVIQKEAAHGKNLHAVVNWAIVNLLKKLYVIVGRVGRSEVRRMTVEFGRQFIAQRFINSHTVLMVIIFSEE